MDIRIASHLDGDMQTAEIKHALFDMAPWKSPRPDGYHAGFYQNTWQLIGGNVCRYIKDLLNKVADISELNCSDLCLIPKVDNSQPFRPIYLCNSSIQFLAKL